MFKQRVSAPGSCNRAGGKQLASRSISSSGAGRVSEPGRKTIVLAQNNSYANGFSGMGPEDMVQPYLSAQDAMDAFSRQVSMSSGFQQSGASSSSCSNEPTASWDFSAHGDYVPPPANTPTAEDSLLFPPRWTTPHRPGIDLRKAGLKAVNHLQQVYVILFGVGQKDTEGIYSLRAFSPDGLPQETIIVFSTEEDAIRYAGLLEATMEHVPQVCSIPPRELLDFCIDAGYQCQLEQAGSLFIPPDFNVGITDWERSLRLREGRWSVLESEPDVGLEASTSASTSSSMQQTATHTGQPADNASPSPSASASTSSQIMQETYSHTPYSEERLMDLRAKLESLLPPPETDLPDSRQ